MMPASCSRDVSLYIHFDEAQGNNAAMDLLIYSHSLWKGTHQASA